MADIQIVGSHQAIALSGPGGAIMLDRKMLAAVAEFSIALADLITPDPDLEESDAEDSFALSWCATARAGAGCPVADPGEMDGDETDGNCAEDEDAASHKHCASGPGCHIADPDCAVDDGPCDAYVEDGL
jgi:hypothetical protein